MFEKEKKQYEEDSKNYERPWELWEYKAEAVETWKPLAGQPIWHADLIYRRKQTTFVPEYYSGLNWRDADHLIGKTVECSNCPDMGWKFGVLQMISPVGENFAVDISGHPNLYIYIRTCEGAIKHPTINIGGVELPMPETVAPAPGTTCYILRLHYPVNNNLYDRITWHRITWPIEISGYHKTTLRVGTLHLTEDRARAWADWWKTTVIDKIK